MILLVLLTVAQTVFSIPFPFERSKPWVGTCLWLMIVFVGYTCLESEFDRIRQIRKSTRNWIVLLIAFFVFGLLGAGLMALFESHEETAAQITPENVESYVDKWLHSLAGNVKVTTATDIPAPTCFAYSVVFDNFVPMAVVQPKEPKDCVIAETKIYLSDEDRKILDAQPEETKESYGRALILEAGRSKMDFQVAPPFHEISARKVMLINNALTQETFTNTIIGLRTEVNVLYAVITEKLNEFKRQAKTTQPYIFARLKIEPAPNDRARFHLLLENGKIPIENVRVVKKAIDYASFEYDYPDVVRMMAPGGKLSFPISAVPMTYAEARRIDAEVYFDASVNGSIKHFVATHRFLLQPDDMKDQTIEPETSNYREGELEEQSKSGEFQSKFAQPQGTVLIVLPEKHKNGSWNLMRVDNDLRQILIDPENRLVSFNTKTATGRVVSIANSIQPNDRHIIMMGWSPFGGSLNVDGNRQADFDKGH